MNRSGRIATTRSIGIFSIALLGLTFLGACQNRFDKDDANRQAQATKGPAQISVENGQTVLTLDTPTQNRLGLEVATLTASFTRAQSTLPAVVLSVQDLATFRNGFVAAQAQLQKSKVEADVARKEYTRLKTLFEQDHNISEKLLQSAEATLQANEADVQAGEQQLHLQESVVRQEWGSVAANWAVENSPELQRVFDQREMLVQMTMPSDATFGAPKTISLEIAGATRTEASLVSTFPRVDPRIQGRSFLYVAPAHLGLTPGLNLLARLSVGSSMKGLTVPTSAVVWSEGKAWIYQQTASDRFTRRAVATDIPVEKGFFVTQGFTPGDRIVTQGAQALLSEEMLLHGQGGGETDEN
jgi:membrane fusion protein, multidrug efflux system